MVWYNPTTWENPLKGWWGAPEEDTELPPAENLPASPAETEDMPVGGRRKRKHRKTKRSKKSKSKKTGRKH